MMIQQLCNSCGIVPVQVSSTSHNKTWLHHLTCVISVFCQLARQYVPWDGSNRFSLRFCFRHPLWDCLLPFPRFSFYCWNAELVESIIIPDDPFSDRRATVQTTHFVEPCRAKLTLPWSLASIGWMDLWWGYFDGVDGHTFWCVKVLWADQFLCQRPGVQHWERFQMAHFFTCFTFSPSLVVFWLRVFVCCLFLFVCILVCCCALQVLWNVLIFNREF